MVDKPKSNIAFKGMSVVLKMRDFFRPPAKVVAKVGLKQGYRVLDYGCGTGSLTFAAAELVGQSGKVFALDIHPLAIAKVEETKRKKGVENVETILSDCATGLDAETIDVAMLYGTLHALSEANDVLAEIHRVLMPNGMLSLHDRHMEKEKALSLVEGTGLFKLVSQEKKLFSFEKISVTASSPE